MEGEIYLRLPQILERLPISKSAWWVGCRTGKYPKPIKLGPKTTVWKASEINAFLEKLGAENEEEKTGKAS